MENRKSILSIPLLLFSTLLFSQKPTEVPKPSDKPIDLTDPADVIIYIVLPLCVILLFVIWRKKRKNK